MCKNEERIFVYSLRTGRRVGNLFVDNSWNYAGTGNWFVAPLPFGAHRFIPLGRFHCGGRYLPVVLRKTEVSTFSLLLRAARQSCWQTLRASAEEAIVLNSGMDELTPKIMLVPRTLF